MDDPATSTNRDRTDIMLAAYTFAWENRNAADTSAWEMVAIVWGAQTLVLGFTLEAISSSEAQPLIVIVAFLGFVLCRFSEIVVSTRSTVCHEMVKICLDIEKKLDMPNKVQNRLTDVYPGGLQTRWFRIVNWSFVPVWAIVAVRAAWLHWCLCHVK
jgi:hypothetical protein